jgi:non-heme chloroperoxidase
LSILSDSPRDYTEGMMHAIISKPLAEAAFNGLVAEALKTPTATGTAMLIADLYGKDRSAAIGKFTVPTLVIASGSSDELSEQKELASRLPNGRIEVVDQAAHAVFVDQPERFYRLVRDFLEHLPA